MEMQSIYTQRQEANTHQVVGKVGLETDFLGTMEAWGGLNTWHKAESVTDPQHRCCHVTNTGRERDKRNIQHNSV